MTMIIGHRGARNLWPENSLSGFANLLDLPVEGVEFDVHLSKAGELLVIHDPTLDRTTDRTGPVADLPAGGRHDLVLVGSSGEGIPVLDEILSLYAASTLELHIELKNDANGVPYPGLEIAAAAAIDAHGLAERSLLTSFSLDVLARVRAVAPHIRTLNSFDRRAVDRFGLVEGLRAALAVADIIAVEKSVLAQYWDAIVAEVPLDRLGAWVPNEEADLSDWLFRSIRQITTDRPDLAVTVREGNAHA